MQNLPKPNEGEISNKLIDPADMRRPDWIAIIDEMHTMMKVPAEARTHFRHCTDRRSIFHRAEIETYKHWEYPWALQWGNFEPGMDVLDCGCGRGMLQIYLAQFGCFVSSMDISSMKTRNLRKFHKFMSRFGLEEDMESAMRGLAQRYNVSLDFHVGNIAKLPFDDASFDRVYSISVLEHMAPGDDRSAIQEMSRVLKPGGRMLVTVDFALEAVQGLSYNEEIVRNLIEISGLKLAGESNFTVKDWDNYINNLRKCFSKPDLQITSAGFVLDK